MTFNTPPLPEPQAAPSRNTLSSDVVITGTLKFAESLQFDGTLEGEIISQGNLTIGKSAMIDGEVKTRTATLYGSVNGNITVTDRCQLKAESTLIGDLKAARILVEEGATFIGKSEVTASPRPDSARPAPPRP